MRSYATATTISITTITTITAAAETHLLVVKYKGNFYKNTLYFI
jgi:hypothetical protein